MASLLDSLGQVLTPETMTTVGNAFGMDPQMVQQGVSVLGPLVQSGLANSSSNPQGLDSLMQMLTPPASDVGAAGDAGAAGAAAAGGTDLGGLLNSMGGPDMLNNVMGMVMGQGATSSANDPISSMVTGLFNNGALSGITAQLDKQLGFKVSALIPIVVPLVIGMLRKVTQEQTLDSAGVAKLLQDENKAFMEGGSKEVQIVQDALKAGQDAVALKSKFTPEEWTKLRIVPMAASALVINVAPSNAVGVGHEIGASMQALADSRSAADPVSLSNIAFDSPFTDEERNIVAGQNSKEKLMATVREGAKIVASKNPDGMTSYSHAVMSVAQAAAQATKEGGFMGFGAKSVNKAEQAALDEIASVFRS